MFLHCFNPFTLEKKTWGFRIRTVAQLITESWSYFGLGVLFQNYIPSMQSSVWLYMISGAAAYNTLTAQGPVKDYQLTFYSTPPSLLRDKDQNQTRCVKGKKYFSYFYF